MQDFWPNIVAGLVVALIGAIISRYVPKEKEIPALVITIVCAAIVSMSWDGIQLTISRLALLRQSAPPVAQSPATATPSPTATATFTPTPTDQPLLLYQIPPTRDISALLSTLNAIPTRGPSPVPPPTPNWDWAPWYDAISTSITQIGCVLQVRIHWELREPDREIWVSFVPVTADPTNPDTYFVLPGTGKPERLTGSSGTTVFSFKSAVSDWTTTSYILPFYYRTESGTEFSAGPFIITKELQWPPLSQCPK